MSTSLRESVAELDAALAPEHAADEVTFSLCPEFTAPYVSKPAPFGFGALGYVTALRTYFRVKKDGSKENWFDVVQRVVEGAFEMAKEHCIKNGRPWDEEAMQLDAQEMWRRQFDLKFTAPGRGLWAMGTPIVRERKLYAALNNCAFVTTANVGKKVTDPFRFLMDMSMLGVGCGFDVRGVSVENNIALVVPSEESKWTFVVPDSREGWVEALGHLISSFIPYPIDDKFEIISKDVHVVKQKVEFDFSQLRPSGAKIDGFGGESSGFKPLESAFRHIAAALTEAAETAGEFTITCIVDMMNHIGVCVVSGNVRRTAEISLGPDTEEYLDLKNYEKNPHRGPYGWTSNNSVLCNVGDDYTEIAKRMVKNGEPGIMWLDNAQRYSRMCDPPDDRDYRVMGGNPCLEQSLEPFEMCCVSGDTRIMTRNGAPSIASVVGKEVEVFNGEQWSTVTPFLASSNEPLYRVTLSDGCHLDVTGNHEWSARRRTECIFKKLTTSELETGMILESFATDSKICSDGEVFASAYQVGWFAGDGFINRSGAHEYAMCTVNQPDYEILEHLNGKNYKEQHPDGYTNPFRRVNISEHVPIEMAKQLRDPSAGLPDEIFSWSPDSIAEFLGGYIDTDGCLRKNPNTDHYVLHGCESKLRDVQMLARRIGINHATLRLESPKGTVTNFGTRNHDLWCLTIPSYEAAAVKTRLKVAKRFGERYRTNPAHPSGRKIDRARKQKIVSIERLDGLHNTFCFTEPMKHMGVFGNCLTYQCLVEVFPAAHDSLSDFLKSVRYAYMYAKFVTLGPVHWEGTAEVMSRNRRIGVSLSGIAQFFTRYSKDIARHWFSTAYDYLKGLDDRVSRWLGVPMSIKLSSNKPSGSVSLLAGATPGVHYPISRYYLRRVRIPANSTELLKCLEWCGYHVEPCAMDVAKKESDPTHEIRTMVVEFPIDVGEGMIGEGDLSVREQLENAAFMQKWWADNQVSCTVKFRREETSAEELAALLDEFQHQLKGISFLPDESGYDQMPYETITEQTFKERTADLLDFETMYRHMKFQVPDGEGDKFCDSDRCYARPPSLATEQREKPYLSESNEDGLSSIDEESFVPHRDDGDDDDDEVDMVRIDAEGYSVIKTPRSESGE